MATAVQPSLETLMAGYMRRQAEAADLGLAPEPGAEVTPYEAGPVQPIDPKLAWDESLVVLPYFGNDLKTSKAPPGWAQLVAQAEPQVAIAFCVGNYPQLVRDFHKLLQQSDLTALRPAPAAPLTVSSLGDWARQANALPQAILALAGLRLARQFDDADALAKRAIPADWKGAWDNELAALAWHRGRANDAIAAWRSQKPTLPVRFNLAMAELFSGRGKAVQADLESIMAGLPENSAWHHLARLYHTLSVLRA